MNNLPANDLRSLGEKLQQSIVLTRLRIAPLVSSRARAKASCVLDSAEKLFIHVSQLVQAISRMQNFISKAFDVSLDDIFSLSGNPKLAKGAVYAGTLAINELVKRSIDELAAVNAALDKEAMKNG